MRWNASLPNSAKQRNVTVITPFKVIQGHSRSPILVPIESSYELLILITSYFSPFPSYGWLFVGFSPARWDCLTLMLPLGVIPCQYRYKWYIAKKTTFRCRKYRCIFNHFCTIRPESNRIRWNDAPVRAITPFKVIQGHRVWYQSKAHMRLPISD